MAATLTQIQDVRSKIATIKDRAQKNDIPIEKVREAVRITLERTGVTAQDILKLGTSPEVSAIMRPPVDMPPQQDVQRDREIANPQNRRDIQNAVAERQAFGAGSPTGGFSPQAVAGQEEVSGGTRDPETGRLVNEIAFSAPAMLAASPAAIPIAVAGGVTASLFSERFDPTPGGRNAAIGKAIETGVEMGLGEALPLGAGKVLKKGAQKYVQSLTGARAPRIIKSIDGGELIDRGVDLTKAEDAQKIITINETGESLNIADAFDTPFGNLLRTIGESALIGGGKIAKNKKLASDRIKLQIDSIVEGFKSKGEVGSEEAFSVFKQAAEDGAEAFKKTFSENASEFDKLVNPKMVTRDIIVTPASTSGPKSVNEAIEKGMRTTDDSLPTGVYDENKLVDAKPLREEAEKLFDELKDEVKNTASRNLLKDIMRRSDKLTFKSAQRLRSSLIGVGRAPTGDLVAGKAQGLGKRLSGILDHQMESKLKDISKQTNNPDLLKKWRAFNEDWKKGKKFWNDNFIKSMMKIDPSVFTQRLSKISAEGIERVKEILKTAKDPLMKERITGEISSEMMTKALGADGNISGRKLFNLINNPAKGEPTRKSLELLGPDTANNLKRLGGALDILTREVKQGKFGMIATFAQVSAAAQVVGAFGAASGNIVFQVPGMALLATPAAIGKYVSNPNRVNRLFDAAKAIQAGKIDKGRTMLNRATAEMLKVGFVKADSLEDFNPLIEEQQALDSGASDAPPSQ